MKKALLKTDDYLLFVDNSEIKEGDWFLTDDKRVEQSAYDWNARKWHKKIIAHLPLNNSPILEGVPLLPPLGVEDFNPMDEYDEEYLSSLKFDGKSFVSHVLLATRVGYNKAREKYKFTEEDMKQVALESWGVASQPMERKIENLMSIIETNTQSLSQPKTPAHFEFEMEYKDMVGGWYNIDKNSQLTVDKFGCQTRIKTTTNSQGQQVVCGKYIY